jgi:hypothetical protein
VTRSAWPTALHDVIDAPGVSDAYLTRGLPSIHRFTRGVAERIERLARTESLANATSDDTDAFGWLTANEPVTPPRTMTGSRFATEPRLDTHPAAAD